MRRGATIVALLGLLAGACSDGGPQVLSEGEREIPTPPAETPTATATATPEPTPTPTAVPNRPPFLSGPESVRAGVDEQVAVTFRGLDPDGELAGIDVRDAPPGLTETAPLSFSWEPGDAGSWATTIVLTDDEGATSETVVQFESRYPSRPDALVALGDSVASGHGLDELDYLGGDPCWRDGGEAYPRRAFDALRDAGVLDAANGEFALVACSGADAADLTASPVDGGLAGTAPDGVTELPQVEWAVRANPGVVTLTAGANTIGFIDPGRFLEEDGTVRWDDVDPLLDQMRRDLDVAVARLVEATDADIYVTDYYNPAAPEPQGVEFCRLACFRSAVDDVLIDLNARIADVAAAYPGRVTLVELRERFEGHGAPNGFGPDVLREGTFEFLGQEFSNPVQGVHPYCARGETIGEPWVDAVDCVHPNEAGATAIAGAIAQAAEDG